MIWSEGVYFVRRKTESTSTFLGSPGPDGTNTTKDADLKLKDLESPG